MSIPQIQSIIQDVLQRAAKPGEAETWNALLQSTLTLDGIAEAIVNSAEATTTVDPVIRMFQGVYGRVPDKAGLDYWVDVYRDLKATDNPNTPTVNEALVALARPFVDPVNTPEFATRYGTNPDGNAYVSALYFNVLGRPADQAGLQYWEGVYNAVLQQQIGKGLSASAAALETRAILLEQFISSAEFIASSDPFITQFLTGAAQQVDPAGLYTGSLMNDAPTDITVAGLTSVAENSNPVTAIATFTSVDKDFGQAATFSIVSDPSGYFEIVGNQLFVKAGAAVNFEAFATVPVTVKVTDAAGASYQEVVNVAITNVNEAPTQVGPGIAAVNENAAAGTVVTTLVTTDPDAGDTFTYAITTNPGGKFAISGNQIVVANGAVLDFESQSSYDIIVRSTDAGGLTVFRQVTVSINDVNEAPSGVALTGNAVAENSAAGTVVGTLSAQDPDGNPLTYSISGGTGASLFEISGNQVVVKAGAVLNFEATSSYTLDISASDGSLSGPTGNFTISVTNVNEAPTNITGTLNPVAENAAPGTVVGTVSAVDPDAAQAFTYAIVGGTGQSNFEISPAGQVSVKSGAVLDFETTTSQTVVIKVTDQGGLSFEKEFTINLTGVNEAPTQVNPGLAAVNENAAAGTVVTTLVTTDPDAGDTFTYAITTNPGGKFDISGNQIVVANGAVLDFETQSSYDIIVRSTDAGGLTVSRQVTVSINDVNEAPSGVALAGNAVAENSAAGTVVGTLSAQDPDGNPITYSISGGTGASLFEISGNQVVVKAGAVLNFEATNSYTLDISASDGSLSGPTGNFTISVTNVNEAPTAITGTLGPIAETAAVGANVGTVATTDQDAGQVFTYTIVGGTAASDFVIAPNGQVTVAPGANLVVTADEVRTLIIRSTDQGGLFTEQSFNVTVTNDVNAPGGNFSAVPGGQVTGTDNNDVFSGTDVTAQNATFNGGAGRDTVVLSLSNQILPPGPGLTNNIVVGMVGNSIEEVIATVNPSAPAPVPFSQVILSGFAAINKVSSVQSQQDLAFLDIQNSNVDLFITDVANGRTTTFDFDAQAVAGGSDAARLHMQEAGGTGGGNIGQTVVFTQNTIPGPQVANGGLETLTLFTSRAGTPTANDTVAIDNLNAGPSLTTLNIVTEVGGLTANLNIGDSGTATSLVTNNPNLSAIDASQHAGDIDIFIAGAGQDYDGSYRGGSSNDVVRIGDALADGVLGAFDGEAGFNTLVLNNEASLSQALTGAAGQFTNFNSVTWQNGFVETNNRLDTALVRGITTFDLRGTGSIDASGGGVLQVERLLENTLHTFNIQKTSSLDSLEIDLDVGLDDADSPNGGANAAPQRGDGNADRAYFNLFSSGTYNVSMDEIEEFTFFTSGGTTQMNFVAGPDPVAANDLSSLFIRAAGGVGTVTTVTGTAPNLTSINATTGAPGTTSGSTTGSVDLDALVVSSAGANFLMGVGNDTVRGQGGNDTIDAGSGNDLVNAGGGADSVTAGEGVDTVNGEAGNDTINGGNGDDELSGGADNDVIDGGAGYDMLVGNAGNDTITGGDEDPAGGGDFILGDDAVEPSQGFGNDLINAGGGEDTVNGGAGDDVINGGADNDSLAGGAGNDTIAGGTGADTMTGGGDANDPLDAAVPATQSVTIGGVIGTGDQFFYRIDADSNGVYEFTSGVVTAIAGDTPVTIATQLEALATAGGFTVTRSGATLTFSETDGTGFRLQTNALDGAVNEIDIKDTASVTFNASGYDVGDTVRVTIDATNYDFVVTAGNTSANAVANGISALVNAGTQMTSSVSAGVLSLTGLTTGTNYGVTASVPVQAAPTQEIWSVSFAGLDGNPVGEFITVVVNGNSYSQTFDTDVDTTVANLLAAHGAAMNADLQAASGLSNIVFDGLGLAGNPLRVVDPDGNDFNPAVLFTINVSDPSISASFANLVPDGQTVATQGSPAVVNGDPVVAQDNTQSFGVFGTANLVVSNGVVQQTNGNDKFIIDAGTTLATMDVITDFGVPAVDPLLGTDTLSFAGATLDGSGGRTVNANLLSNGDLVGFVSLDAAILFANTVLNGNPQVEYLTAWVENGIFDPGFDAGVDQVYVLSDVNTAGASDNLVSQVVGLQNFGATTISGALITL